MACTKKVSLSYLERTRAIRTLLCLLKSENKGLDELLTEIGGSKTTAMNRISELLRMKLVKKEADPTRRRVMRYSLTEKGKKIVKDLQDLINLIESDEEKNG